MRQLREPGVGYPVWIGSGSEPAGALNTLATGRDVMVLSDRNVAPHHLDNLCQGLDSAVRIEKLVLPAGEDSKSLTGFSRVLDTLIDAAFHRDALLVALGGGVIGDLGGYAAACYQRGIDWVAVPTTLLAQVDAAIGGKTAINHAQGKNLIGAFHDPLAVWADPSRLDSLATREYRSGIAEVIKYGLGLDGDFFAWLEENAEALDGRRSDVLTTAIETSARTKLKVVAADRTERGSRALLNLGHTLGHALETALGHGTWLHGEAVAVGLLVAAELSARRGTLERGSVSRLRALLQAFNLPVKFPADVDHDTLAHALELDKKILSGRLRFIGLEALGKAAVWSDVEQGEFFAAVNAAQEAGAG